MYTNSQGQRIGSNANGASYGIKSFVFDVRKQIELCATLAKENGAQSCIKGGIMIRSISILLVVLLLSGCASAPVYKCKCDYRHSYGQQQELIYTDSCTCTPQKDRKNKSPLKTSGKANDVFWEIDDVEIEALTTDKVLEE